MVHTEGGGLDDEDVLVFVDNQTAELIAFGIDHAERGGLWQVPASQGKRVGQPRFKEGLIGRDDVRGQHPDADFGACIVEAGTDQAPAMVFDGDHRTVFQSGWGLGD